MNFVKCPRCGEPEHPDNCTIPAQPGGLVLAVDTSHLDQCECGDYRQDHKNGTGPCTHNKVGDLTHGFKDCQSFRLAVRYEPKR